jgi:hypothetical protein
MLWTLLLGFLERWGKDNKRGEGEWRKEESNGRNDFKCQGNKE